MQLAPELQAQIDRRRSERIHTSLTVRYGQPSTDLKGRAENVSEGGLYVLTNKVFNVGARIRLVIEFQTGEFEHEAEVMWAIAVPEHMKDSLVHGMGLQFVDPPPEWPSFFAAWRESVLTSRGETP